MSSVLNSRIDGYDQEDRSSKLTDSVNIASCAYAKIIFHAFKYPHCAINGILLASKSSVSKKTVQIVDVIPLFHQCLYVTPMAEIALSQIEAMAEKNDLVIAGYYAASENYDECSLEQAPGEKIAEKIVENFPKAFFVVIDNSSVCLNAQKPAISVWQSTDGKWSKSTFHVQKFTDTLQTINKILTNISYRDMADVMDFDNHLDNPENDWTNAKFNDWYNTILDFSDADY